METLIGTFWTSIPWTIKRLAEPGGRVILLDVECGHEAIRLSEETSSPEFEETENAAG
jgi:hypothetical protein